jgi:type VI secretion system protein ImpE
VEALQLFRASRLREAIEVCVREVKKQPSKPDHRDLLSQLLCFTGDWERADKHLETLALQCPDRAAAIALIRQLIRAAEARQQCFTTGRLPEFVAQPPLYLQHYLQASICLREGQVAEAAELLARAEQARPPAAGRCGGVPFQDLRDADDLTAGFLEAFTTNGKYYWLPFERVRRIILHPPETPLDVLWRRCQIAVAEGPNGIVYLPQLYVDSPQAEDESVQVGRSTEWRGAEGEPVRGVGHRLLWINEELRPLVSIDALEFSPSGEPPAPSR